MVTKEDELRAYCKLIAEKVEQYQKQDAFLVHFAKHLSETISICSSPKIPHKKKLISIINFVIILSYLNKEEITFDDCINALNEYHTRQNVFSVGQNGEVKIENEK